MLLRFAAGMTLGVLGALRLLGLLVCGLRDTGGILRVLGKSCQSQRGRLTEALLLKRG